MYFDLVHRFRSDYVFGESRAKNFILSKEFGVKKYPQILLFCEPSIATEKFNSEYGVIKYTGELKLESIERWLESVLRKIEAFKDRVFGAEDNIKDGKEEQEYVYEEEEFGAAGESDADFYGSDEL